MESVSISCGQRTIFETEVVPDVKTAKPVAHGSSAGSSARETSSMSVAPGGGRSSMSNRTEGLCSVPVSPSCSPVGRFKARARDVTTRFGLAISRIRTRSLYLFHA